MSLAELEEVVEYKRCVLARLLAERRYASKTVAWERVWNRLTWGGGQEGGFDG